MKAPFLSPGTITRHCDFSNRSRGIPLSGADMISFRTSADVCNRVSTFSAPYSKPALRQTTPSLSILITPLSGDAAQRTTRGMKTVGGFFSSYRTPLQVYGQTSRNIKLRSLMERRCISDMPKRPVTSLLVPSRRKPSIGADAAIPLAHRYPVHVGRTNTVPFYFWASGCCVGKAGR